MTLGLWGRLGVADDDWSVPHGSGDACGVPIARSKCPAAPAAAHASPQAALCSEVHHAQSQK